MSDKKNEQNEQEEVAAAIRLLAFSVFPRCIPTSDASGSHVESLTEAVMGVTGGLMAIASAINRLADEVCETREAAREPFEDENDG
jgi:hypothetical protein